jgi:hypothetical protein
MKLVEVITKISSEKRTEQFLLFLRNNCFENLKKFASEEAPLLYRGMSDTRLIKTDYCGYGFFNERRSPRVSKTKSNMIMNWTSFAPSWSNVPRRDLSSSCALSDQESVKEGLFGRPFIIIPFDNVKNYAWTADDFNYISSVCDEDSSESCSVGTFSTTLIPNVIESINNLSSFESSYRRGGAQITKEDIIYRNIIKLASDPVFLSSSYIIKDIIDISELIDEIYNQSKVLIDDTSGNTIPSRKKLLVGVFKNIKALYEETGGKPLYQFLKESITPKRLNVNVTSLNGLNDINAAGFEYTAEIWFTGAFAYLDLRGANTHQTLDEIVDGINKI